MPLYDYQCDQCGHRFEVRQGIREDPLTVCPQCGAPIRRVIHPVGIVFKGSGFYVTDSRNKSTATSAAPKSDGDGGDKPAKEKASSGESTAPAASSTPPATGGTGSSTSSSGSSESKTA